MALMFELVSPERLVMSREVAMAVVPGAEGDFGVLEGHAPLVSTLRPGVIDIRSGDGDARIFVAGGFSEVAAGRCTVLAEEAVEVADLDRADVQARVAAAREALAAADDDAARRGAETELAAAEAMAAALETD